MTKKVTITVYRFQTKKGNNDNYINYTLSTIDWDCDFSEHITPDCLIKRRESQDIGSRQLEGLNFIALCTANELEIAMPRPVRTMRFYEKICEVLDKFLENSTFEMEENV